MRILTSFVNRFWQTFPGFFEPVQDFFNADLFAVLAKKLQPYPTATVLDLGCGGGSFLTAFSPKQYVGIDLNPDLTAWARRRYHQPTAQFITADALTFVPKQSFDLVAAINMTHHLTDRQFRTLLDHLARKVDFGYLLVIDGLPSPGIFRPLLELLDVGADFRPLPKLRSFFAPSYKIVEEGTLRVKKGWYYYPFVLVKKKRS